MYVIACDQCADDLTCRDGVADENPARIALSKEVIPVVEQRVGGIGVLTPTPHPLAAHHFCDLDCLKAWIDAIYKSPSARDGR